MKKQKKILLIFLGDFNYDARCINMIDSLISKKLSVSILHVSNNHKPSSYDKNLTIYSIQVSKNGFNKYWGFHKKALGILKQYPQDTIIACDLFSLAAISRFSQISQLIYDCREVYSELFAHRLKPLHRFFWKLYEKKYIYYMNDILFTAKTDLIFLKNLYPRIQENSNLHIIYNYPKYKRYDRSNLLHYHLNLDKSKKIILYQGVIQKGRGINKLINVIANIPNAVAVILGSGEHLSYYKNLVYKLKLNKKCYFITKVPYLEMLQYAGAADLGWVLINPNSISNQFALPNKLFEYLLMGTPVLASSLININIIMENKAFGAVVEFNDMSDIQNKSLLLLKQTINRSAIHLAAKQYTWESQSLTFTSIINH